MSTVSVAADHLTEHVQFKMWDVQNISLRV
jgi:hypothetical protein